LFAILVAACAVYLGDFGLPLKPKPIPIGPPHSSSTYPPIYVRHFDARIEAEQVCGKNNVLSIEAMPPTENEYAGYICRDWDDKGPL
jgi:hypothetical protein